MTYIKKLCGLGNKYKQCYRKNGFVNSNNKDF